MGDLHGACQVKVTYGTDPLFWGSDVPDSKALFGSFKAECEGMGATLKMELVHIGSASVVEVKRSDTTIGKPKARPKPPGAASNQPGLLAIAAPDSVAAIADGSPPMKSRPRPPPASISAPAFVVSPQAAAASSSSSSTAIPAAIAPSPEDAAAVSSDEEAPLVELAADDDDFSEDEAVDKSDL